MRGDADGVKRLEMTHVLFPLAIDKVDVGLEVLRLPAAPCGT